MKCWAAILEQHNNKNYSISSALNQCSLHWSFCRAYSISQQDIIQGGWTRTLEFIICIWCHGCFLQCNDKPEEASGRVMWANGFVIAGGSGMLILEEEEHAIQRISIIAKLRLFCKLWCFDAGISSQAGTKRCMSKPLKNMVLI